LDKLQEFLLTAPVLLFSMVAHEYAHGYAALKQGDPTAYQLGRLTWNPVKHIDPFLTILIPIVTYYSSGGSFIFGGAKPVPVNPRNYHHFKRGDIIVSMAGIATNAVLAVLCTILVIAIGFAGRGAPAAGDTIALMQQMLIKGILFNLILAMFNLLPIPPLDGSHVMKYLLPPAWSLRYQELGRYGLLILILLLWTGVGGGILSAWMAPVGALFRVALGAAYPFILTSPFTAGT
jgi:Zn-dependent protease